MSLEILMSGEESSMVSTWTVYLCLEKLEGGAVQLSERQYEGLGMADEYAVETEDGDTEYELPDEIDGKTVVGIDDEVVVGGDLTLWDDSRSVRLGPGQLQEATAWVSEYGWDRRPGFPEAWKRIEKLLKNPR